MKPQVAQAYLVRWISEMRGDWRNREHRVLVRDMYSGGGVGKLVKVFIRSSYDSEDYFKGDVGFNNLERSIIRRTIWTAGGKLLSAPDVYEPRREVTWRRMGRGTANRRISGWDTPA